MPPVGVVPRREEASYWVVDPLQPSSTVFELVGGRYRQVVEVKGDDVFEADRPYPVRIVPVELLDDKDR